MLVSDSDIGACAVAGYDDGRQLTSNGVDYNRFTNTLGLQYVPPIYVLQVRAR